MIKQVMNYYKMAIINYEILSGEAPFNVKLIDDSEQVIDEQNQSEAGVFSFLNIEDGEYIIVVTDDQECQISFPVIVYCSYELDAEILEIDCVDYEEEEGVPEGAIYTDGGNPLVTESDNYIIL